MDCQLYGQLGATSANIIIGVLSAILDNIPLMFAVLTMQPDMSLGQWLLITLTTGGGGVCRQHRDAPTAECGIVLIPQPSLNLIRLWGAARMHHLAVHHHAGRAHDAKAQDGGHVGDLFDLDRHA